MTQRRPLDVVFCWHMHQPQYRRSSDGEYEQPWTYLHAIKDYTDMAWHLEQVPNARAVVNFTPVLLEQLDDYTQQFASGRFRDPLLCALADPASVASEHRSRLADALVRANEERMIRRYPAFAQLADAHRAVRDSGLTQHLTLGFVGDLAVWYHIAWLGESVVRESDVARRLIEKAENFDAADRRALLELMAGLVGGIVPRYRALAAGGQVELSTSPFAHPIVPLLIDFRCALERMPEAPLPQAAGYPGGAGRAAAQTAAAVADHTRRFGSAPGGCWPSEGAVSDAAVDVIARAGFRWTASCESVLLPSLHAAGSAPDRAHAIYQPYAVGPHDRPVAGFFRDVHLSDLIGFRYATWHADDAVANFVSELEAIAEATHDQERPVVSIILDGENAWEHYPHNAYHFLSALYRALVAHPALRLTTFSDYLASAAAPERLEHLVAGSWVYGTFSTWIGDRDKNRAWDLLAHAKAAYDRALATGALTGETRERAERQLAICEGSDWFWWFGDYNPAQTVSDFDRLFRTHLADLYRLCAAPVPEEIEAVIGVGSGTPLHGGTMRANESAQPEDAAS